MWQVGRPFVGPVGSVGVRYVKIKQQSLSLTDTVALLPMHHLGLGVGHDVSGRAFGLQIVDTCSAGCMAWYVQRQDSAPQSQPLLCKQPVKG